MKNVTAFTCSKCKEYKIHKSDFTTGYGQRSGTNEIVCYECIGEEDAEALGNARLGEKFTHYLSGTTISNWPGSFKIEIRGPIKVGRHNMAGRRYDVWFTFRGKNFHGTKFGDNTEICHIKCIK